ncbi:transposase family protein [Granulicella tundricola]|uniref:transposase family protein n=1 Tax=Granulicella tundricola TaxID=940615 RepID=UPI001E2D52BF|nr:transposase family protein [Granulicella tundricola]
MRLKTCRVSAQCPRCGTSTKKVHSRYVRRLADLPWHGVPVVIHLQTRRFFCVEPGCQRKVFTEPLPGTVALWSKKLSVGRSTPLPHACLGRPSGSETS